MESRKEISQIQKRICSLAIKIALAVAIFFLVINENAIAKGLLLGTLFSIANFLLMGISIPMTVGKSRYRAGFIGLVSILVRYGVLAIPLIVGVRFASFNFIAVIVGVFSIQIVTLLEHLVIQPILKGRYSE